MDWLRTFAFRIVFFGISVPVVLGVPFAALFGRKALRSYANWWTRLQGWTARIFVGIEIRVEGEILATPALYPAKHQSMFEALALTGMLGAPATVMKRELAKIPLWGWAAKRYGIIIVDRTASATALRGMMREAKAARAEGRSVLIFPEGTRVAPGETPPLQSGFAGLYRILDLPVVPVAVTSGHVWPRKGPMHPGVVTIHFGEPIPPGLPRKEIEARVHDGINRFERVPPAA